jgi:hypothetical protein
MFYRYTFAANWSLFDPSVMAIAGTLRETPAGAYTVGLGSFQQIDDSRLPGEYRNRTHFG